MNDKMREEFETAARAQGLPLARTNQPLRFANGHSREAGDYIALETLCAFWAWQASREALVIDLPDDGIEDCRKEWPERGAKYEYDTFDTGYLFACMKHEQAIEAAGLKVTPCSS